MQLAEKMRLADFRVLQPGKGLAGREGFEPRAVENTADQQLGPAENGEVLQNPQCSRNGIAEEDTVPSGNAEVFEMMEIIHVPPTCRWRITKSA